MAFRVPARPRAVSVVALACALTVGFSAVAVAHAAAASDSRAIPGPSSRTWILAPTTLAASPGGPDIVVHLGAGFPVTPTETQMVGDVEWLRVAWLTSGAWGQAWLPASSLTDVEPSAQPSAGLDALSADLERYVEGFGSHVGIEVFDVTRGRTYAYNAEKGFKAASSMKVPIMLAFLSQLEDAGREPTGKELHQLKLMIEESNNTAAYALYAAIGDQAGITAYMRKIGVTGIAATSIARGFGLGLIAPEAMVSLLDKLRTGAALNASHTALALRLMSNVVAHERIGVGDSSPAGAQVAMKDGWTDIHDGSHTSVMNSSGIVTLGTEVYIVAVFTDGLRSWNDGWTIARNVCREIGLAVTPVATPMNLGVR